MSNKTIPTGLNFGPAVTPSADQVVSNLTAVGDAMGLSRTETALAGIRATAEVAASNFDLPETARVHGAASGVDVTPELLREIAIGLIGVPEDQKVAAVGGFFEGPAVDCRSCTHPGVRSVDHEFEDGGWVHDIEVGEIPVVGNDFNDDDDRALPLTVGIMRFPDRTAGVDLSSKGWGEIVQLDLAGVREAIRVLTSAERLLALEVEADGDPR